MPFFVQVKAKYRFLKFQGVKVTIIRAVSSTFHCKAVLFYRLLAELLIVVYRFDCQSPPAFD